ncbi:hypothetical protein vseg_004767 [Gypsophila vaccaria]
MSGSNANKVLVDPEFFLKHLDTIFIPARRYPITPDSMCCRIPMKLTDSLRRGRDFKHFRVFLNKPLTTSTTSSSSSSSASPSDFIIRYYIHTLSQVLGSEEEAVEKIYSVATRHYYAFGANVTCGDADSLKALPNVCAVDFDEYVDLKEKRYPWDPFINGQALPYDSKYYPCYSNEESGMASQETSLSDSYGEANNGLEVPN